MPASLACPTPIGRVLTVGPGKQYVTIRAAAAASQSGDTIHISAGEYRGDVATWSANNLTICGVGGRATLYADGVHEGGKGIWVIAGSNTTIHSVAFHGARVPDQNGAGIRQEGPTLTLRDAGFYDNENGVLSGGGTNSTITIEYSEFARNGFGDGFTHNIYIGEVGALNVRYSFFHEAKVGHNLKTRARENTIENSYFADGASGTSSYLLNFDNGGRAVVRGNLLHKGSAANNSILISHYANIWGASYNSLTLEHNTVVSTYPGGRFIDVNTGAAVTLTANIFAGTGNPSLLGGATATQANNVVTNATQIPGASNVAAPNFWPAPTLLPQLNLAASIASSYTSDSPRPYAVRAISGATRLIGALQSTP
ncbi:MAG: hypothetical protein M3Q28_02915 [Pseudomonadota bacterium]|nr:hypothetical protein [Pseudomonadota bacterium]